jgi:16S rRNA (uracil1498-N3)-methyltransferase
MGRLHLRESLMPASLLLPPELFAGEEAKLEGDVFHHLVRVRRLEAGEKLQVVDGRGQARSATLAHVGKKAALLLLGEPLPPRDPSARLHLLVGALRPERASWLVEKATELGVYALRFLNTERTPRQYGQGRFDRYEKVAIAALEQCQGARLPLISGVHSMDELPALLPAGSLWILDPLANECLSWPFTGCAGVPPALQGEDAGETPALPVKEGAVLIGPEGGFSPAEETRFAELGARGAFLGTRILRVETAAIAAAAILLASSPP